MAKSGPASASIWDQRYGAEKVHFWPFPAISLGFYLCEIAKKEVQKHRKNRPFPDHQLWSIFWLLIWKYFRKTCFLAPKLILSVFFTPLFGHFWSIFSPFCPTQLKKLQNQNFPFFSPFFTPFAPPMFSDTAFVVVTGWRRVRLTSDNPRISFFFRKIALPKPFPATFAAFRPIFSRKGQKISKNWPFPVLQLHFIFWHHTPMPFRKTPFLVPTAIFWVLFHHLSHPSGNRQSNEC